MTTRVYKYGCPRPTHKKAGADFDEPAINQLRLANQLWNDLVAIHRNYEETERDMLSQSSAEVAGAETNVEMTAALIAELRDDVKKFRQQSRTTTPDPKRKSALQDAQQAHRAARGQLKTARKSAREHSRPLLDILRDARKETIKATRQQAAANGLHWGTYNDILQRRFPAAGKQVMNRRQQGLPAELHFHRFDGSGTLTTQIMGGDKKPLATIGALMEGSDSPWRNVAQIKLNGKYATLTLRVASGHTLTIPFVYHRPIPAEAEIKEIKVSRRRTGSQWRLTIAICVRLPDPPPPAGRTLLAIALQQVTIDHTTQVARITSSRPLLPPPAELDEVVKISPDRRSVTVFYSGQWRKIISRDFEIRGFRDRDLDLIRADIVTELTNDQQLATELDVAATQVARWRAPHRFVSLLHRWPTDHPFKDKFTAWQRRDRHLWDYEANELRQVLDRRNDAYRKVAAWLLADARQVVVHNINLATRRQTPDVNHEDTYVGRHGRANAHAAAPGIFRSAIENFATRNGIGILLAEED